MWTTEFDEDRPEIVETEVAEGTIFDRRTKWLRTHTGPLQLVPRPMVLTLSSKLRLVKQRTRLRNVIARIQKDIFVWMQPSRLYSFKEIQDKYGKQRVVPHAMDHFWTINKIDKYAKGEWYKLPNDTKSRSYFGVHYMLAEPQKEIPTYTIEQIAAAVPCSGNNRWDIANFVALHCLVEGFAPSFNEVVFAIQSMGGKMASSSGVKTNIDELEGQGFLTTYVKGNNRQTGKVKIRELEEGNKAQFLHMVKAVLIGYRSREQMTDDVFIRTLWYAWCIPAETLKFKDVDAMYRWAEEVMGINEKSLPDWYRLEWVKYRTGDV